MDVTSAVEHAIVGIFFSIAIATVLANNPSLLSTFSNRAGVEVVVATVAMAIVIWIGYTCSIVYHWVFNLKGGYESKGRPCVNDIMEKYGEILRSEDRLQEFPRKRLVRLAYYAWAYAQEKYPEALSSVVIARVGRHWKRAHFLGSNLVSIVSGLLLLVVAQIGWCHHRTGISLIVSVVLFIFAVITYIRFRQEVAYIFRLEKFIVAENWPFLEKFLRSVDSIEVENF